MCRFVKLRVIGGFKRGYISKESWGKKRVHERVSAKGKRESKWE